MAISNNNSLSDAQKIQEVKSLQKPPDWQLKAILSSAQYDKLTVVTLPGCPMGYSEKTRLTIKNRHSEPLSSRSLQIGS
jgi:hypothetical protein